MEHPLVVQRRLEVLAPEASSDHIGIDSHPARLIQAELAVGDVALEETDPVTLYVQVPCAAEAQMTLSGVVTDLPLLRITYLRCLRHEAGELVPCLQPDIQRGEPPALGEGGRGVEPAVLQTEIHPVQLRPLGVDEGAAKGLSVCTSAALQTLDDTGHALGTDEHAVGIDLAYCPLDVRPALRDGVHLGPSGERKHGDKRLLLGHDRRRRGLLPSCTIHPVLAPLEDVLPVPVKVLHRTVGDGLRHAEGYLRQSSR